MRQDQARYSQPNDAREENGEVDQGDTPPQGARGSRTGDILRAGRAPAPPPHPFYFATAVELTASLSASARSVLSHVNSGSVRPKWP